jgi:transcription elongation factor Elf1
MGFKEVKKKEKRKGTNFGMKKSVPCPSCGSVETLVFNKIAAASGMLGIFSFLEFAISIWIPILGWITAPIFVVSAVSFIIYTVSLLFMKYVFKCITCGKDYKISKIEYFRLVKENR